MILELLNRRNKEKELDEFLSNIEAQTLFLKNFQEYMNDLRLNNRIIDNQLDNEIFVYKNLQLELNDFNFEKIEKKVNRLLKIIENYKNTKE